MASYALYSVKVHVDHIKLRESSETIEEFDNHQNQAISVLREKNL